MSHATDMTESCHTCEWVMSRIWMSHVPHVVIPSMNESWHTWMSHGTRVNESWSHATHFVIPSNTMNESCHTYEWVMPHMWMSHGTRVRESWHTCEWVMAHMWMSHGTHMNESWRTSRNTIRYNEWTMPHVWMGHGAHMNESCHTYGWVMSHVWMPRMLWYLQTHEEGCRFHQNYRSLLQKSPIKKRLYSAKETYNFLRDTFRHTRRAVGFIVMRLERKSWLSYGTHVNESWHIYQWVMAHMWMSHGTHINESWHTCESFTVHIWISHVT